MKIKDLSFCVEVTEENTANVDGGYIRDISSNLFDIFPGVIFSYYPVVNDSNWIEFQQIRPITVPETNFGGLLL
jgi:hypothetical protein